MVTRFPLSVKDQEDLETNKWLSDQHINAANDLLRRTFPESVGLCDPVLQHHDKKRDYVQILHVDGNHWVTISDIGQEPDTVLLFDSLHCSISPSMIQTIARFHKPDGPELKLKIMNVPQQKNGYDCGAYAIAFATSLLNGDDPTQLTYLGVRKHLVNVLKIQSVCVDPFPSKVTVRTKPVKKVEEAAVYCICRGIIMEGDTMIECKRCVNLFHRDCVGVRGSSRWCCTCCKKRKANKA